MDKAGGGSSSRIASQNHTKSIMDDIERRFSFNQLHQSILF